ncbi:MAG: DUF262 domain-containing protein [Bacteroidales bacterium]|nr:DUF262 domain-containing protein [Bacteroidales bacterium]
MKIELKQIKVRELFEGFVNNEEEGVLGYYGKLNIRPKYQREFVYKENQQKAVIDTIIKGFPLNVMYWVKNEEGTFELLDGQQRTLSICSFLLGEFFIDWDGVIKYASNLTKEQKESILNYDLMIYICSEGSDAEKLDWFQTINIAGEKLTTQEIRNAIYAGSWVTAAKRKFSKTQCVAYKEGSDYMTGNCIRQEYLETVLKWICDREGMKIEEYMAKHMHDENADELWMYFKNVMEWVKLKFTTYRKEMKNVEWGLLYNKFKDHKLDATALEKEIKLLMEDDEVENKKGIYYYVLDRAEKHLNLRAFSKSMARSVYEKQKGICPICKKHFEFEEMEADHIIPWSKGGKTTIDNCQMLCKKDNIEKSNK